MRLGIGERGRARVAARLFRIRANKKPKRVTVAFWQKQVRFRSAKATRVTFRLTRRQARRMRGDVRLRVVVHARGVTHGRMTRVVWFRLRPGGKVRQVSSRSLTRHLGDAVAAP